LAVVACIWFSFGLRSGAALRFDSRDNSSHFVEAALDIFFGNISFPKHCYQFEFFDENHVEVDFAQLPWSLSVRQRLIGLISSGEIMFPLYNGGFQGKVSQMPLVRSDSLSPSIHELEQRGDRSSKNSGENSNDSYEFVKDRWIDVHALYWFGFKVSVSAGLLSEQFLEFARQSRLVKGIAADMTKICVGLNGCTASGAPIGSKRRRLSQISYAALNLLAFSRFLRELAAQIPIRCDIFHAKSSNAKQRDEENTKPLASHHRPAAFTPVLFAVEHPSDSIDRYAVARRYRRRGCDARVAESGVRKVIAARYRTKSSEFVARASPKSSSAVLASCHVRAAVESYFSELEVDIVARKTDAVE
jgi:hypothetical protein